MARLLRYQLRITLAHPAAVLLLALLSVVGSLYLTATRLEFSTDRTQLLDPGHPIQQGYRAFREEFGGNTDLVILVAGQPGEVHATVDQLGEALSADTGFFQDVLYRLDLPQVARHSLYFLSLPDLQRLQEQAEAFRPWIPALEEGRSGLIEAVNKQSEAQLLESLEPVVPIVTKILQGALLSLRSRGEGQYASPLPVFTAESERLAGTAFEPGQTTFYNTIGSDSACMVIARPSDPSGSFTADTATIARLRSIVAGVLLDHPSVNCLVSGEPVINTDEMVGARNDAVKCSLTALMLVSTILALAFGDIVRPLCAVVSLLVGLSWAFAFAALTVGTLNLLTVHFATILVGLSMTFAIQLLSHYQDLRSKSAPDRSPRDLLEEAVSETGTQTLIGAVTTAVAFWTLHWTNFRAAGELGLITGTGVLLTFASIWIIFPVLVDLSEGDRPAHPLRIPGFVALGQKLSAHVWWVLLASLLVTLYSATWINRVPFNYNVLSLQAKGSDSVGVEHLLQSLGYSSLYAVATAPSLQEAEKLTRRFQALQTVAHVESVASLVPQNVEAKREPVEKILDVARQVKTLPHLDEFLGSRQPFRTADQLLALQARFQGSSSRLGRVLSKLASGSEKDQLTKAYSELESSLNAGSPGPLEAGLRTYEAQIYEEFERYRVFLAQQQATPPDMLAALPPSLRNRSISKDGNFSLRIFPRADVWEREPLQRFVLDLEKTDAKVTGTPLLIYYYLEELRLAYSSAGSNALLVIAVLLLLHYRSLVQASLALFPKLLGVVWMLGLMGVCGVSFNPANFLALPITLGIGLVFGVNILSECRRGGVSGLYGSATGSAVLLSGVVATVGFASFALANHVGVASFGFVMAAGVSANMVTSLVTLPALLGAWERRRGRG